MMRQTISVLAIATALLLPAACSDREQTPVAQKESPSVSQNAEPEELGRLGARIANEPQRAEELISAAGMTREQFEATIRRISASPDQSREYARGYEKERTKDGV